MVGNFNEILKKTGELGSGGVGGMHWFVQERGNSVLADSTPAAAGAVVCVNALHISQVFVTLTSRACFNMVAVLCCAVMCCVYCRWSDGCSW